MLEKYTQEPTMESKNERSFQGVWIPKEIYLDDRLGALDKILLAEIASLDTGDGCINTFCFFHINVYNGH